MYKKQLFNADTEDSVAISTPPFHYYNTCLGYLNPTAGLFGHYHIPSTGMTFCDYFEYWFSMPRFLNYTEAPQLLWNTTAQSNLWVSTQMLQHCESTCNGQRNYWKSKVEEFCGSYPSATVNALLDEFEEICISGCDTKHPQGSSSINPIDAGSTDYDNFQLAMEGVLLISPNDPFCNASIFSLPQPFDQPGSTFFSNTIVYDSVPGCTCEILDCLSPLFFGQIG